MRSVLSLKPMMEMTMEFTIVLVAVLALSGHVSATCRFSDVATYTTTDKMMSSKTALIAEFKAKCSSAAEAKFFAAVGDEVLPVVASTDGETFEVSWTGEHKNINSGSFSISILSDEGYSAMKRAQRSGSVSDVKPLETITIQHPGLARTNFFIQTEFLALVSSLLVWWAANGLKRRLSE